MTKKIYVEVQGGCVTLEAKTSEKDGYGHPAIVTLTNAYCGFILESK